MVALSAFTASSPAGLPDDVVFEIFDNFEINDLVAAAGVCGHWRAVGLSHPTFSQSVELTAATRHAVERFRAQLSASPDGPLFIVITITDNAPIINAVLAILSAYVHRIQMARFELHVGKAPALFRALRAKAPILTWLSIIFREADKYCPGGVELPCDLLGGFAPNLTSFTATDAYLPNQPLAALKNAQDVNFGADLDEGTSLQFAPRRLGACFPAVRKLQFIGAVVNALERPDSCMLPYGLDELLISCYRDTAVVLRCVPDDALPSIKQLTVEWSSPDIVRRALLHLDNELHLTMCVDDPDEFHIIVADATAGLQRRFAQSTLAVSDNGAPAFFAHSSWHSRVTEVTVSHSLWAHATIAQHIPPLPSVKRINIVLDIDDGFPAAAARLNCLSLQAVGLIAPSDTDAVARAGDVEAFLSTGLLTVPHELVINVAEGLVLEGSVEGWTVKMVQRAPATKWL